jgi:hypothetical protein
MKSLQPEGRSPAMLEPFTWGVNLLFSIAAAYVVIIVGRRLFR